MLNKLSLNGAIQYIQTYIQQTENENDTSIKSIDHWDHYNLFSTFHYIAFHIGLRNKDISTICNLKIVDTPF